MKLHELHVRDARAGQIRQRDAVAGRDRRIRRFAVHLARAAGRDQRRAGARLANPAARVEETHARHAAVLDERLDRERMIDDRDVRLPHQTGGQHSRLISRPVASRACRTRRTECAPFAGQVERAVRPTVEAGAPCFEFADVPRPFFHQHAHGCRVAQAVAGRDRVGKMQVGRIVGTHGRRDAALGEPGAARRRDPTS